MSSSSEIWKKSETRAADLLQYNFLEHLMWILLVVFRLSDLQLLLNFLEGCLQASAILEFWPTKKSTQKTPMTSNVNQLWLADKIWQNIEPIQNMSKDSKKN